MNWQEYISSNENVLLGKPTITGTRLSVEHIIGLLAQGWSEQQILDNYPRLTPESLQAVFAFIQDCIKDGLLYSNAQDSIALKLLANENIPMAGVTFLKSKGYDIKAIGLDSPSISDEEVMKIAIDEEQQLPTGYSGVC